MQRVLLSHYTITKNALAGRSISSRRLWVSYLRFSGALVHAAYLFVASSFLHGRFVGSIFWTYTAGAKQEIYTCQTCTACLWYWGSSCDWNAGASRHSSACTCRSRSHVSCGAGKQSRSSRRWRRRCPYASQRSSCGLSRSWPWHGYSPQPRRRRSSRVYRTRGSLPSCL